MVEMQCEDCWDMGRLAISDCTEKKKMNNLRVLPSQLSSWPENQGASVFVLNELLFIKFDCEVLDSSIIQFTAAPDFLWASGDIVQERVRSENWDGDIWAD